MVPGGRRAAPDERDPEFTEIETSAERLGRSELFHIVKEVIGFVLYMHQQIPAVLQHLEVEFDSLREECRTLEQSAGEKREMKVCDLRIRSMRVREVKQRIRRLEKSMTSISRLLSSLQLMFDEIDGVDGLYIVLGSSLVRPLYVYEVVVSNRNFDSDNSKDGCKSKLAETLSRKIIRALLSKGAGGSSYTGPLKMFILVKAPTTLNLPLHFLPKRDFRYSKKTTPFRLRIKCHIPDNVIDDSLPASQSASSDSSSADIIWFQCKQTVKGLICRSE